MLDLPHFLTISSRLSIVRFLIQFFLSWHISIFLFCLIYCLFFFSCIFILFFIFYPFITRIFVSYLPCWTEYCKVRRSVRPLIRFRPKVYVCVMSTSMGLYVCVCVCLSVMYCHTFFIMCERAEREGEREGWGSCLASTTFPGAIF